ncbi:MAG TPA: hypothetical protein DIT28_01355 [Oxalobacteraceae bacterium]|nr:hypothetical protein [Oxalobacteraceae bacterium]
MTLRRVAHWQRALRDAVHRHHAPFAWGTNDCCSFVCDCVLEMTGVDIYAEFRGKYSSELDAQRTMRGACGSAEIEAVAEYVTAKFEMQPVDVYFAQAGDVVLLPAGENGALALGIVAHDNLHAMVVSQAGLNRVKYVAIAKKAWRV